ncbi:MAG: 6-phospho-beta-glucosidase [Anaerolineaceae bacterium]
MKICIIGGGSTYTPELINGFLARVKELPLTELWLMDTDRERLEIVGGFARRMASVKGSPFKVVLSGDQRKSIRGAAYVLTQFRVGQMPARRSDEYLGRRHGLVGQETTGVGGMAKALRTIPVILKIAADMRELTPDGILVNFTNPSGLITQALSIHAADVASVGVCNVGIHTKMDILDRLEKDLGRKLDARTAELKTLGLNHLSWHRGFTLDGEDMWPQVMRSYLAEIKDNPEAEFEPRTVETLGMIPNYYLEYFYHTARMIANQAHWPPSRAEEVIEVEKDLLRQYADPALIEAPADLIKRGGAYYSTAATQMINAHFNDLGETHILNTRNNGAVAAWPFEWVLELPCRVDRLGVHPIPAEPLPPVCFGLIAQVKSYELLTIEAAVHGDRTAAYQALLAHPLGPPANRIQEVLDDLLETNREYLPAFWR